MANLTTRLLWASLVASQFIYVLLAWLVELPPRDGEVLALLTPVLCVMALATAVGTIFYRRHALVGPIQSRTLDLTKPAGFAKAFQPFMLNLVLSESIGIYGLFLAFLSGEVGFSAFFGSAAVAMLWHHRPTSPELVPPMGDYRTAPPIY
ncbi:MAG: hypothetical protein JRH10_00430 [Deltaproteobacteria bacterium]|nr:hypothetical protein [Deltaproteobacteria bacterium]MBW2446339.1 hypothetical protein [Deltaproteobacteria bacterium]